jgi:predicted nucleotidyltransferase
MEYEISQYIPKIIESLKSVDPMKIIIFGSFARDEARRDSDLDLLIVLNNQSLPHSYEDKVKLKLSVRRAIRGINHKIPIDVLVYTIPEYNELLMNMGSFFKEIHETGKVIYEKAG